MPAPWDLAVHRACCSKAPTPLPSAPAADCKSDPVADVLDWLAHYDMGDDLAGGSNDSVKDISEDDVCDEAFSEEAMTPGRRVPKWVAGVGRLTQLKQEVPKRIAGVGRLAQLKQESREPEPRSLPARLPAAEDDWEVCGEFSRGCFSKEEPGTRDAVTEEEAEWDQRRERSGTVGRLVVYHVGECATDDFVLRGGGRHHFVVAGVREGGPAARAGVKAGDRLASINGRKDFVGLRVDAVREQLEAPVAPLVLVFLGFVGKLQAEVRLTCDDHGCGIPTRRDAVRGSDSAPLVLCEERIFDAGIASLFLTAENPPPPKHDLYFGMGAESVAPPIFELQRNEAQRILRRALRKLDREESEPPRRSERRGGHHPNASPRISPGSWSGPQVVPPLPLGGPIDEAEQAAQAPRLWSKRTDLDDMDMPDF